jgi:hypothetical protein
VADYEKDAEGEWLPKLCGAVIHAAASYKPGTLDLLHAGQEAHAGQLHTQALVIVSAKNWQTFSS